MTDATTRRTPAWLQWGIVTAALLTSSAVVWFHLVDTRVTPEVLLARQFGAQLAQGPAPDFNVVGPKGERMTLSQLAGNVVFVNFWATWCPPCRKEIPDLERLAESLKLSEFKIFAVSSDESWDDINGFFKGTATHMHVGLDVDQTVAERYGTEKLPETYVVDTRGQLRLRFINAQPWSDDRIQRYLEWLAREG